MFDRDKSPLHLFNKVYVDTHDNIDVLEQGAVIHADYVADPHVEVSWSGTSLADSLTDSNLKTKLVEAHAANKRFVIYGDINAFASIVASWCKSTTNMDADAFSQYAKCLVHKRKTKGNSIEGMYDALVSAFALAETFDFSDIDFYPSIEFLVPTLLSDSNSKWKTKAKNAFYQFIKRDYEADVIEAKFIIDTLITNDDVQNVFGGTGKTLDNYHDLPDLQIFKSEWWNDTNRYETGHRSKFNLADVSAEEASKLKTVVDKFYNVLETPDPVSAREDWTFINSIVAGSLTDDDLTAILNKYKSDVPYVPYITTEQSDNILFVFLSYVRQLIRKGDTATLSKYNLK
jgi:hypothetical protein